MVGWMEAVFACIQDTGGISSFRLVSVFCSAMPSRNCSILPKYGGILCL